MRSALQRLGVVATARPTVFRGLPLAIALIVALLTIAGSLPVHAASGLQSFVVALNDFTVLEATRAGRGVSVRWTQRTLVNRECMITAMRSHQVTLPDTTIDELAGVPLCQVDQRRVDGAVSRSRMDQTMGIYDIPYSTLRDRIVATCNGRERAMTFNYLDSKPPINPATLQQVDPAVAGLYSMGGRIRHRVERMAPSVEAQEAEGTLMATALRGGRYASAYDDLCVTDKGAQATCVPPFWQQLLDGYEGPPTQRAPLPPIVRERETLPFTTFVQPVMSPIARAARTFGDVTLRLSIQPDNGAVTDVALLDGHPFLNQAARDAALQWRFAPGASIGDPLDVTVSFVEGCPARP